MMVEEVGDLASDEYEQESANPADLPVITVYSHYAQQALSSAESMAATTLDGVVTCEHLLLALLAEPKSAARHALEDCGFDAASVASAIEFIRGNQAPASGEAPAMAAHSPRVERVLANAGREAAKGSGSRIETLHLLIGIVREGRGIAALTLESPGVGHGRLGSAISQALRNGVTDPS